MSEDGSWLNNLANRIRGGRKPETAPKPEELTPKQKAQKAFYGTAIKSLTPEGLTSTVEFFPPNPTFSLDKLGDGAVIRVKYDKTVDPNTPEEVRETDRYQYFCIAKHSGGEIGLYTPGAVDESSEKRLVLIGAPDIESLRSSDPSQIWVEKWLPSQTILDWEHPDETIPARSLDGALVRELKGRSLMINLHRIDVVDGGTTVNQASPKRDDSAQAASNLGLAPSPQAS